MHHRITNQHILELPETTPGTLEDYETVEQALKYSAENIIGVFQAHHGTTLCISSLEELETLLSQQSCYISSASNYDESYKRFNNPHMLNKITSLDLPKSARILDLAGGTGNLAAQLYYRGYSNIILVDQSQAMLQEAEKKLGTAISYGKSKMQEYSPSDMDLICIRQAINYLNKAEIEQLLKVLLSGLNQHGKIIFNTFINPKLGVRSFTDGNSETHETNQLIKNQIQHCQYTTNWKSGETYYDTNTFFNIQENEWRSILTPFSYQWEQNKQSILVTISKT